MNTLETPHHMVCFQMLHQLVVCSKVIRVSTDWHWTMEWPLLGMEGRRADVPDDHRRESALSGTSWKRAAHRIHGEEREEMEDSELSRGNEEDDG